MSLAYILLNCDERTEELISEIKKIDKATGFLMWERIFEQNMSNKFENTFKFIFYHLQENKLKMFKWKLIHFILPCKDLLCKWKISGNNLCSNCGIKEDYEHQFFKCSLIQKFINTIQHLLKYLGYGNHIMNLENMVTGYKINEIGYYNINHLMTIIYFCIYKSYFVSEKRSKSVDILKIFKREIEDHIEICKIRKANIHTIFFNTMKFLTEVHSQNI